MAKYISGERLCREKKLEPLELLEMITSTGLQPHDKVGRPIPPPDVRWCNERRQRFADWATGEQEVPFPAVSFDIDEYLATVQKRRDSLVAWTGFDFNGCPPPIRFSVEGQGRILAALGSRESLYLANEVARALKGKTVRERALSPRVKHDRAAKEQARWYAKQKWVVEGEEITKAELAKEILKCPQMPKVYSPANAKAAPKPYSRDKVKEWIADLNPNRTKGRRRKKQD